MSNANDRQVAGTHYRTSFQHWDLAAELDMGYFEGQITKYVTRHRSKKGKEDADKALHFAQKLLELVRQGKRASSAYLTMAKLDEYCAANKLGPRERAAISAACNWGTLQDAEFTVRCVSRVVEQYDAAKVVDSGVPGVGYVNQDR